MGTPSRQIQLTILNHLKPAPNVQLPRNSIKSKAQTYLHHRNAIQLPFLHAKILQLGNLTPVVLGHVGHEQLIEGAKSTWNARRQTYQPKQQLLVPSKLADRR